MNETAPFPPPSEQLHRPPYWEMATSPHPETLTNLVMDISSRLSFLAESETAPTGVEHTLAYDPRKYDTSLRLWDQASGTERTYQAPLDDVLSHTFWYKQHGLSETTMVKAQTDMTYKYLNEAVRPSWWHTLDALEGDFAQLPFTEELPTEQYIIGQEGKGIRFYNFSASMKQKDVEDCKTFVDTFSQYFGDRTYDFVTDVVITNFSDDLRQTGTAAFVKPGMEGVLFLDSLLLNPEATKDGERLLDALVHEGGHFVHGTDKQSQEQLLKFAKGTGWDVDTMLTERPEWHKEEAKLGQYAPDTQFVVTFPNGTKERMSVVEAQNKGVLDPASAKNGISFYMTGAPSNYGRTHPRELSAETTSKMMLGNYVTRLMPETRDAWLEHMQQRVLKPGETPEDRPLATPLDRAPIEIDHRVGDSIVYPRTKLPEKIYVKLRPEVQVAA